MGAPYMRRIVNCAVKSGSAHTSPSLRTQPTDVPALGAAAKPDIVD